MSEKPPNKLQILATRYVAETAAQWGDLCDIACSISADRLDNAAQVLSKRTKGSKETLKRKLEAVQFAQSKGIETEAIKAIGQEKTLGDYVKAKKSERVEGLSTLSYRMAPDLKERVQSQFYRIAKILKLKTSDQLFEFIHSNYVDLSADEIRHLAGDGHAPNKD